MYNLKDRKVLVTGASRGLGAVIAKAFAEEGCDLAITYLGSKDKAEAVAADIRSSTGRKVVVLQAELSLVPECERIIDEAVKGLGGLDIVVSNAGNTKIAPFGDIDALTEADWDHTWNLLVKSNVFLLRAARPHFNANPDGGVFLIQSSVGGLFTNGSSMAYSVCRAAGLHLNKCLAETQGPKIRVNAVCPGLVHTERTTLFTEEQRQGYFNMAKLKRITTPEEIAMTFVFAAKNSGMTGERIRVDSGMIIV
ncbi:putative short chain dehydrogenase [Hyaloscypha finlandica]|nr:putative short chain dehydrogenase [Hyaloscypha finlandica]